jgi:hypothetical protein
MNPKRIRTRQALVARCPNLLTLRSLKTAEAATLPHTYAVYAAAVANVTTFIVTPKGGRVLVVTGKHLITIGFAGNGYCPPSRSEKAFTS